MTELTPIIEQIAEALDIGNDAARQLLESAPNLIREMSIYSALNSFPPLFWIMAAVLSIIAGLFGINIIFDTNMSAETETHQVSIFKKVALGATISAFLAVGVHALSIILAPNWHAIMKMLEALK